MCKYSSVDALKQYFAVRDTKTYENVMQNAKKDTHFEKMIQDMTLGRVSGRSRFDKNKRY